MNKQSEKLAKAIAYEAKKKKERDEDKRPAFHVTPTTGWCNDPNGFSRFGEEYHLFYQYYPYENKWGPMHWGHCRTKDFIKWEELPCALAPDMEYDGQGCFSGTAVEHEGKHILMYTSVLEKDLEDGTHMVRQTQSIAIGDGENYEKVAENPVITADCLPEGSSYAAVLQDVLAWSLTEKDWRQVWRQIEEKWDKDDACPEGAGTPFNIDAKLNGAAACAVNTFFDKIRK